MLPCPEVTVFGSNLPFSMTALGLSPVYLVSCSVFMSQTFHCSLSPPFLKVISSHLIIYSDFMAYIYITHILTYAHIWINLNLDQASKRKHMESVLRMACLTYILIILVLGIEGMVSPCSHTCLKTMCPITLQCDTYPGKVTFALSPGHNHTFPWFLVCPLPSQTPLELRDGPDWSPWYLITVLILSA